MIRGGAFYDQPKPTLSYPPAEIIVRHCNGAPSTGVKRWGLSFSWLFCFSCSAEEASIMDTPYHYYGGGLGLLLIVVLVPLFRGRA